MTAKTLTLRCAAAVLAGAAALSLAACGPQDAQRDEATGEITASAEADVFSLQVGDCLDMSALAEQTEVETLPTLPCSDPHDGEVYAETTLADADKLPSDLVAQAEEFCGAEFEPFVGMPYETSTLEVTYLHPTDASWGQGDRGVQCVVIATQEPVTGTLEGSAI